MVTYLVIFAIAFVTALLLVPMAGALAVRLRTVEASSKPFAHTPPAPRTGGLALFAGFLAAVAYGWQSGVLEPDPPLLLIGILVGGALIAMTGFLGDIKRLSFLPSLLFQFLAASMAVGLGVRVGFLPLIGLDLTLTLFYMVGCANAIYRLDAVDGLAGGVFTTVALGLGTVAAIQGNELVVILAVALAGVGLGFQLFNFPRIRVLMGDGNSLSLGFLLAACAVLLTDRPYDLLRFSVPLAVLGVPVLGLVLAGVRRLRRRDGFLSTDRAYPYDLLIQRLGVRRAIAATWGASLLLGSVAAAAAWVGGLWGLALVVLAFGIVIWLARASGVLVSLTSASSSGEASVSLAEAVARVYHRYLQPVLLDLTVVAIAFYLALVLRFSPELTGDVVRLVRFAGRLTDLIFFVAFVYVASGSIFGLYNRIWQYASSQGVLSVLGTGSLGTLVIVIVNLLWVGERPIPLSIVLMGGLLSTTGFVALRYRQRLVSGALWRLGLEVDASRQHTLIVGAGDEGQLLARRMQRQNGHYVPVGFVDDDQEKIGLQIHGIPVLGTIAQIPELAAWRQAGLIVIAMPGVGRGRLNEIFEVCRETSARIQILPDVMAHLAGANGTKALRDLSIEDLLGRPPREVDRPACRSLIAGKVVLVTGAAGSIGSELCCQVARYGPARLVAVDQDETGLYDLGLVWSNDCPLDLEIGSVFDENRMQAIWRQYRPDVVFHCAAYKHVPLLEECPTVAIKTNVLGTLIPAALSQEWGTAHFIFISSDKAACPINVLGASKRVGELLMMAIQNADDPSTRFSVVRFGNVLGSRGSVVPTFAHQIDQGGPVTITHPQMERFFMSVLEAVSLVIQAGAYATGGDLFILDMGEEVLIEEVARKMIRLRGLRVEQDIQILYTDVRAGEKLSEILLCPVCEALQPTHHGSILRVQNHDSLPRGYLASKVARMFDLDGQPVTDSGELRTLLFDTARLLCPPQCDCEECE